jgi:electron transport complex protein RnfG
MSKVTFFIQQSWLLIVASFVFGLLLAAAKASLDPYIQQNIENKRNALMSGLISSADRFEVVEQDLGIDTGTKHLKADVFRALDTERHTVGFAFMAEGPGFADKIKLVIAVDATFSRCYGFDVLASNETPGFGDKIKNDFYRNQFKGAPVGVLVLDKVGDPERIDDHIIAISGATVSSEAVVKIFNTYMQVLKDQLLVRGLITNGN